MALPASTIDAVKLASSEIIELFKESKADVIFAGYSDTTFGWPGDVIELVVRSTKGIR